MKRFVTFVTLLFVLSVLGACVTTGEPPVKAPVSVGIDKIVKKGELVVGTAGSMPPLNMTTKKRQSDRSGTGPRIRHGIGHGRQTEVVHHAFF